MKKAIIVVLVLVMGLFTGCSAWYSYADVEKKVEEVGETITEAIKTKDADLLKTVLSEKALVTDDLDKGIDYLFSFVDEEISSVETLARPESRHYDGAQRKYSVEFLCMYSISTNSGKEYLLYFCYNTVQDFDETELGVNRIMILVDDDLPSEYKVITEYTRAGIVTPDWSDDD